MMSWQMVGSALGSESTEVTSQPLARKARPTEPVPLKSSSSLIVFFGQTVHHPEQGDQGGAQAGELQVAAQRLGEGPLPWGWPDLQPGRTHGLFPEWPGP